ncbi:hypothetical protein MCNF_49400 [Mycolicibacterium confluentis]|uniref:Uncharacterized protein n=1 Tax=Mycolicibacterium confluentis TaxID=28047 RepID=A0A7I7Y3U6_9MYCO|nr:hypothetical protein MCNF_49400 [Mycolicibacterium confluentis]
MAAPRCRADRAACATTSPAAAASTKVTSSANCSAIACANVSVQQFAREQSRKVSPELKELLAD